MSPSRTRTTLTSPEPRALTRINDVGQRVAEVTRPAVRSVTRRLAPADTASNRVRWEAVVRRNDAHDGRFVYAVSTTGVYCRPSCPSRRARREHVEFFDTADAAEGAGYRPCRRCTPREPATRIQQAVMRARAYLDAHVETGATLTQLAQVAGCSPHHLQRAFTRAIGMSPKHYVAALRADRLKGYLRSESTVTRAMFEAGYGSSSRVYDDAPRRLGMTPAAYRNGGRGVTIRYATTATRVGRLLVAASPKGVCAAMLGDSDVQLARTLADEFPNAERGAVDLALREHRDLRGWMDAIAQHIEGDPAVLEIPRDVPGTDFQQRVWTQLRAIPFGETRSYGQVARAIGAPGATRAVANACAANRVAVVVPCHRVVRGDGEPGGYRWGNERKRKLLSGEASARATAVVDLRARSAAAGRAHSTR